MKSLVNPDFELKLVFKHPNTSEQVVVNIFSLLETGVPITDEEEDFELVGYLEPGDDPKDFEVEAE